jgi:hypothetical protein
VQDPLADQALPVAALLHFLRGLLRPFVFRIRLLLIGGHRLPWFRCGVALS